jgi:hypothetical protein
LFLSFGGWDLLSVFRVASCLGASDRAFFFVIPAIHNWQWVSTLWRGSELREGDEMSRRILDADFLRAIESRTHWYDNFGSFDGGDGLVQAFDLNVQKRRAFADQL